MAFYRARMQAVLKTHGDIITCIEAEIELPDFYPPVARSWLDHAYLDGPMSVIHVGYDAHIGRPVLSLAPGMQAPDYTLEEWLERNKHWHVAEKPTFTITPTPGTSPFNDGLPPFSES